MNRLKELKELRKLAEELQLDNCQILRKYNMQELCSIYNGIGPDAFPDWLRDAISALHPSLAVVALIHDVEWHESDQSQEKFDESNARFKQNGYAVAKNQYAWYDPRRYIVMNQARRFGNICQALGWSAWTSPCKCAVCEKKEKRSQRTMHKFFLFIGVTAISLILTGCGHNAIQYGDGVGFDVGINPENCALSMNLRYGKILSAVTRDNVEIEVTGKANADGTAGAESKTGVATDGNLKIKIGRQINGATVDLIEAGADPDKVVESLSGK